MSYFGGVRRFGQIFLDKIIASSVSIYAMRSLFVGSRSSLYTYKDFFKRRGDVKKKHLLSFKSTDKKAKSLDLGCGQSIFNPFEAFSVMGVDVFDDLSRGVLKCHLGFERIPFDDATFDYVTAVDLIEHIPRFAVVGDKSILPFIDLMNEVWRVLKKGGVFLSITPVYPFCGAFQDPTHNNIITQDTFEFYFSNKKKAIAIQYGIVTDFEILSELFDGQHLISILRK